MYYMPKSSGKTKAQELFHLSNRLSDFINLTYSTMAVNRRTRDPELFAQASALLAAHDRFLASLTPAERRRLEGDLNAVPRDQGPLLPFETNPAAPV